MSCSLSAAHRPVKPPPGRAGVSSSLLRPCSQMSLRGLARACPPYSRLPSWASSWCVRHRPQMGVAVPALLAAARSLVSQSLSFPVAVLSTQRPGGHSAACPDLTLGPVGLPTISGRKSRPSSPPWGSVCQALAGLGPPLGPLPCWHSSGLLGWQVWRGGGWGAELSVARGLSGRRC